MEDVEPQADAPPEPYIEVVNTTEGTMTIEAYFNAEPL